MEAMQLQPVKANMTYPSRISRVLDLPNKQDIIEVEPVLSRREVKRLPFIEANTKEVSMEHLKSECIVPVFSKDNEITFHIQTSLKQYGKQPTEFSQMIALNCLKSG